MVTRSEPRWGDWVARARPHVDLRGERVLVVEDNPVNQLVAEGVLNQIGYEVVVADNGAAGVAAYGADSDGFVAILMDCQMPVMNGYDATRAIRSMDSDGPRTPILAMTAAAVAGERQRCLDSGMDDVLLKPVDRAVLEETLRRWVLHDAGDGASHDTATEENLIGPPGGTTDDLGVLDRGRLAGMLEDDAADLELVLRIIDRFSSRAEAGVVEMAVTTARADCAGVVALAHNLRGGAANVGLSRLASLYADIETNALDGHLPLIDTLGEVAAQVVSGVRQLADLAADLTGI